ncbi:MAG: methyltransferase domain-containing protein [Anaerolineae bacterium]|nr:methyltransferase domain-containing protein [Anaerolineae bacterium]NIO00266.1 methyltransferase domain-containing protein [Anaerolineae bacterium]NIQ83045.1 methyltransferase domain-containing protein [Anaerolineae bacterium]
MNESPSYEAHDPEEGVFQLQADLDFTKHLGGQAATERLVDLCRIDASKYVLDVGCGVGITPGNIAKSHGCKVLGVDLRESMIARAEDRAVREGVHDRAAFRVAPGEGQWRLGLTVTSSRASTYRRHRSS